MRIRKSRKTDIAPVRRPSLAARLARDTAGNTLAIVGAALLPLAAMIGSGVDMSRAYMAKNRLQSACDAAALAGRRVMRADTVDAEVRQEATRFFNFNFPQGLYGTGEFAPTITRPESGTVRVVASTALPTTIMGLFGFETLPLNVECDASLNFVNTDIVLVLDVTGSMLQDTDGNNTNDTSRQKITALRAAVMALYDELRPIQDQLEAAGLRLRIGIVPYSSTVNVGRLIRAEDPSFLRSTAPYQSRRLATRTLNRSDDCTDSPYYGSYDSSNRRCTYYEYIEQDIGTSAFMAGNSVNLTPIIGGSSPGSSTARYSNGWAGCIEERDTVAFSPNANNIPSAAYDLDIDRIPDNDRTRWVPHWPDVVYLRDSGSVSQNKGQNDWYDERYGRDRTSIRSLDSSYYACPSEARRLRAWNRSDLDDYVDALTPIGGTYHDIGMIWGARLISSAGIFGDSPTTHAGMPVSRHVIFMTDGQLQTGIQSYSAYGVEMLDRRVVPLNINMSTYPAPTNQDQRHSLRFRMTCDTVKRMDVSIWVIAFGTSLNDDLEDCATSDDQASTSDNSEDLIARFRQIGNNIGALRLTQ